MHPVTTRTLIIHPTVEPFGFSANSTGGHMARSMMLDELQALVRDVPVDATAAAYRTALVEENAAGKATLSSRRKTYRHLLELYALDPRLVLFRLLRVFAAEDPQSLPLLGLVCAFGRDEQLRHSFELIQRLRPGEVLDRSADEAHIDAGYPRRFSRAMRKSLAQNVRTTWTATGHLSGRRTKVRSLPDPRMVASVYAMLAGYLLGLRGEVLMDSVFARLVAAHPGVLPTHLGSGAARGWLRFRHAGGVAEIDFSPLLTEDEQRLLHVTA